MTSIRRRLTVPEVTALLDQAAINNLITSPTINNAVTAATVNGLLTSAGVNSKVTNKMRVGSVLIPDNNQTTVNVGATVTGAVVCFNEPGNIETACGVTWSGSVLTIRNSSGSMQNISYVAVVA